MTLTLTIGNVARLDNGMPTEFVLSRRGAVVGRAASCDWSLPDPRNHISSRHFEIIFDGSGYILTDVSTNGTYLNGASTRLPAPHRLAHGDVVQIGHYEIAARLTGDGASTAAEAAALPKSAEWRGWDDGFAQAPEAGPAPDPYGASGYGAAQHWDSTPAPAAAVSSGRWQPQIGPGLARQEPHKSPTPLASPHATGGGWHAMQAAPGAPVASAWTAHVPAPDPASDWSSAAPDRPAAPSPDDVWGRIAEGNVVDWARGGFGQPVESTSDPLGLARPAARDALPVAAPQMIPSGWDAPSSSPAPATSAPSAPPAFQPRENIVAFLTQTGLSENQVTDEPGIVLARSGRLLRRLVAGLVVMVEARARAKAQLGAEMTAFTPEGNNPIKFARSPEEAMAMLLNPPQRGFMDAENAIEDAYVDLQSHQMATIRAMQGALRATLDRFSPTAIRARAESKGLLERILPGARDAALWQAYEREFGGVAHGSDEAFMDVFAKEFREAYNAQAKRPPP
ncbi:type VI secretion system-associated FHA domain protein TagH [Sphingomonas sp. OK281]|uniref:type VI secretion system-associated FHA domain protein TagH n=1 Tax=Sphingomonas sp. OK281 TaxID=1881067 RepID=UPI0008EBDC0F|nr:type VI secretion system-associated FHA domain protein TagH [Sphingomonas sp. OK281]SFO46348.1 FHA domain protein [Sphingomonas sp. OK281]